MHAYVRGGVCAHMSAGSQGMQKSVTSPRAGIIGGCKMPGRKNNYPTSKSRGLRNMEERDSFI